MRGKCSELFEGRTLFKSIISVRDGIKIDLSAAHTNLCVRPVSRHFNGLGDVMMGRQEWGSGPT